MKVFDPRGDVEAAGEPAPRIAIGADPQPDPSGRGLPPAQPRLADAEEVAGVPEFEPRPVRVELEISHCSAGYLSFTFENPQIPATRLTPRQALAMKAITQSLNAQNARMANGQHVARNPDALRWILDKVADQLPPELVESVRAAA